MSTCSFQGKTVIVTGASSGIGRGTAVEFAKHGANLVLGGRNVDELKQTKSQCVKEGLGENQVVYIAGDIAEENIQKQYIDAAINGFSQIDVNNAGMFVLTFAMSPNIADFDRIHNVNLRSTVNLTLLSLPHLIKTKGSVVNISSVASTTPIIGGMAYCLSKAGMDMFTKSLAFEVAPQGVRVNSVNPGTVPTNIGRYVEAYEQNEESMAEVAKLHPVGRLGEIKEIVDSILFLASDKSSFITGQLLYPSGGWQLGGVSF